jgi:hypothetical protein
MNENIWHHKSTRKLIDILLESQFRVHRTKITGHADLWCFLGLKREGEPAYRPHMEDPASLADPLKPIRGQKNSFTSLNWT